MAGLELHEAASVGDQDSLEQYMRSGKYDVNLRDVEWGSRTALHWASTKGRLDTQRHCDNIKYGTILSGRNIHVTVLYALTTTNFRTSFPDVIGINRVTCIRSAVFPFKFIGKGRKDSKYISGNMDFSVPRKYVMSSSASGLGDITLRGHISMQLFFI
jgi:hypothetical protein